MKNGYTSEKIYVKSSPYGSLSTGLYNKFIGADFLSMSVNPLSVTMCIFKSISNNGSNVQNVCLTDKGSNVGS